ncbi:acyl-CoA dehydrogenase family protein [Schauerella aestuarii]|nr:acyl-CoA dehydrogenase family protein [Achromobacter aestuarii]MYZ42821.1 acyl-CoA dehydrogenase [Achromobacter aestuarii]
MQFSLSPEIDDYRTRIRTFVDTHLIPVEADRANYDEHDNIREAVLEPLRAQARADGLWALQMPRALGGQGLSMVGLAACYEEMNRSIFGPVTFNAAAPDDGNMRVLAKVARPDQQARWLQPIIDGRVRSSFVMTEPHPGSGSDPSMMRTTATRRGDKWVIEGRKWFITGAGVAQHFILIARTSDDARKGLSAFLFDASQPGWRIERRIPIMGPEEHGGHCEIAFEGLEIPDENRLMEVGDGLKLTQIRLGPARLTHCMRWLGLARRAMAIGVDYVSERHSFGQRLADREGVQWLLGEAAMQIEIGRLLTMRAAERLDQGHFARKEVSMAKIVVSETLHKAVDTALQLNGARGYSKDTPLEWIYRYARQARLVDGASEVHKMVLARHLIDEGDDFWKWDVEDEHGRVPSVGEPAGGPR